MFLYLRNLRTALNNRITFIFIFMFFFVFKCLVKIEISDQGCSTFSYFQRKDASVRWYDDAVRCRPETRNCPC